MIVWVAAGFGRTAPLAVRPAVAVIGSLVLVSIVSATGVRREIALAAERQAKALAQAETETKAAEAAAREAAQIDEAKRTRQQEAEAVAIAARQAEQARRREETERLREGRIKQILAAYPAAAQDLSQDDSLLGALAPPPPWGAFDGERKTPETNGEYLVRCSSVWIRRKCAAALADVEIRRGLVKWGPSH